VIGPYVAVLRTPHAARLAAAAFSFNLVRMSAVLPLVFYARDRTGSFAGASVVLAAESVGGALAGPFRGRMVDRHGPRRMLPRISAASAVAAAAFLVAGEEGAPTAALALFGFLFGTTFQPVGAVMRTVWAPLHGEDARTTAFAFLTVMYEMTMVCGPLLGALLLVVTTPAVAFASAIGASVALAFVFSRSPGLALMPLAEAGVRPSLGPLSSPGFRALLAVVVFYGITFGALEPIALPAFASEHGSRASAGLPLAAIALGIASGGFAYGLVKWRRSPGRQLPFLCVVSLVGVVPPILARSIAAMVPLMLLFGVAMAPTSTAQFAVMDDVVPRGTGAEAFGWLQGLAMAGSAVGSLLAGQLVGASGPRAALIAVGAATAVAALLAVAGRRSLALKLSPGPS
jgi:predicted MFS family arabinose efflux permease